MAKEKEDTAAPASVKVKVTGQAISEAGVSYSKGDTFETTAERAKALGEFVEVVA
jgi:hypothetical protein